MGKRIYDRSEIIDVICKRLAEGEPLRKICRDEGMPAWQKIYEWMDEDEEFAGRIARARRFGYDAIAEEALEIADTQEDGVIEEDNDGKIKIVKKDATDHRRLRVWTRLQLLAKWFPSKYGDKQSVELTGAGGSPLDDATRAQKISAILAKAAERAPAAVAAAAAEVAASDGD
jgi:hypothetical protein